MAGKIFDQFQEPIQYCVFELRVASLRYTGVPAVLEDFVQWVGAHFSDNEGIPLEGDQGAEGVPDLSLSTWALIECLVGVFNSNVSRVASPSETRSERDILCCVYDWISEKLTEVTYSWDKDYAPPKVARRAPTQR